MYKIAYSLGGTVHLVCRSEQRGKEAQDSIIRDTKNEVRSCGICLMSCAQNFQKVHLHLVDMSKPKEVLKFATQFVESGAPLDTLVKDDFMSSPLCEWSLRTG